MSYWACATPVFCEVDQLHGHYCCSLASAGTDANILIRGWQRSSHAGNLYRSYVSMVIGAWRENKFMSFISKILTVLEIKPVCWIFASWLEIATYRSEWWRDFDLSSWLITVLQRSVVIKTRLWLFEENTSRYVLTHEEVLLPYLLD